ncbi:hypothetical protein [Actinomyces viscosus]|uniref:hypothetical protein n=1 Tax=Actinomyces viscosus TaxID=1656 RepID=UPI0028E41CF7|nr:hypothetical protein [Actinomyces viscosus]
MTVAHLTYSTAFVERELRRDARTLSVVTLAIISMLVLSTCHFYSNPQQGANLTVTTLNLSEADQIDSEQNHPNLTDWKNAIAVNGYYITGAEQQRSDAKAGEPPAVLLFGRRSSDKSLQWATRITTKNFKPASVSETDSTDSSSSRSSTYMRTSSLNTPVKVSPDGNIAALLLEDQRASLTYFVIISTSTGSVLRTAHFTRPVIRSRLTDTHLAVETSERSFPGGSGRGRIEILSTTAPEEPAITYPTDQWLTGADHHSFYLTPNPMSGECESSHCTPMTLTRIDGKGNTVDTITGATETHFGGWITRYTDPQAAASLLVRYNNATSREQREAASSEWSNIRIELLNTNSGTTTDITNLDVTSIRTPTGPRLLVRQSIPSESNTTKYAPLFWLSAADDGHPHTEDLEQFQEDS